MKAFIPKDDCVNIIVFFLFGKSYIRDVSNVNLYKQIWKIGYPPDRIYFTLPVWEEVWGKLKDFMQQEDQNKIKTKATNNLINDVVTLIFSLYSLNNEIRQFTIMANLAIVMLCLTGAWRDVLDASNSNTKRMVSMICVIASLVDITTVMLFANNMSEIQECGIISLTGFIILCSMSAIVRNFYNLIDDYKKADLGIKFHK